MFIIVHVFFLLLIHPAHTYPRPLSENPQFDDTSLAFMVKRA